MEVAGDPRQRPRSAGLEQTQACPLGAPTARDTWSLAHGRYGSGFNIAGRCGWLIGRMSMDKELRYLLEQGPTSVKELARLTGRSTSGLYKTLGSNPEVQSQKAGSGEATLFFIKPKEDELPDEPNIAVEPPASPQEATPEDPSTLPDRNTITDAPAAAKSARGRKPTAMGKRLTPLISKNPRRQDSSGFRSLQIIITNPGISTEQFVAQGGKLNDLRWDIAKGNVRAD